jgi:ankyrin repeat protein
MVDVVDDEGMSALMRVCEDEDKCDVEKVSDLLSQGANPLIACPPHRLNSLHIAAIAGHAPILTLLVQKVPDAVDVKDARGMTALHFAAKYSREQAAKVLLQANANKDAQR